MGQGGAGIKAPRVNEQIRVPQVLLIGQDGTQVGVVSSQDALVRAQEAGMDLVEVAPNASPPVCRIMDYGKFKYQQKKKLHSTSKHQSHMKEIRLRPKTEQHDLQVKLKHTRELLEKGSRVTVNMVLKGREAAHANLAKNVLDYFVVQLVDIAKADAPAATERNRMSVTLIPKEHAK